MKMKKAIKKKISKPSKFNFITFLKKLVKIPRKQSPKKIDNKALLYENREILFGGLAEPITRGKISEPYDAGKYQGPVLYGVGTSTSGQASPPNNCPEPGKNYSSYVDNIVWSIGGNAKVIEEVTRIYSSANPLFELSRWTSDAIVSAITRATATTGTGAGAGGGRKNKHRGGAAAAAVVPASNHSDAPIPRCWAIGIPLTFGQGQSKFVPGVITPDTREPVWDWDKAGGGTNHEMEHAIKCITQAMLNFLSQKPGVGYSAMRNILYKFFYNILKGLNVGE